MSFDRDREPAEKARRERAQARRRELAGKDRRELREPQAFRALAHPLRLTLIELLTREGSLTATEASELTGESPASCSFHFRQLAKYGFVEDAGGGHGRERPWRRADAGAYWADVQEDPETAVAAEEFSRLLLQRHFEWIERYLAIRHTFPVDWREAAYAGDSWLYLTLDEFKEVGEQFQAVLDRHRERTLDPRLRPEDSRPVALLGFAFPLPPTPSGN